MLDRHPLSLLLLLAAVVVLVLCFLPGVWVPGLLVAFLALGAAVGGALYDELAVQIDRPLPPVGGQS